jgi:glycosyltransferase involved in cell wall biosynthesis
MTMEEETMITVIIPAYNEAGNIEPITRRISEQLKTSGSFEILFVDDGSTDTTLEEIKRMAKNENRVKYISFSRNFGHQKALKAGLDHANGDCTITMDADLQHPPELIKTLLDNWKEGYDVVYTVRKDTEDIGWMKKFASAMFYKIVNRISDVDIPLGAADFRLLDKKVVSELKQFKENWLFIRGLVSWLGFKQVGIEYHAEKRHTGRSKYSLSKMVSFSIQGITSFSILPLRVSIIFGLLISMGAFVYAVYALYAKYIMKVAIVGWTSILISVLFLGGIQLIFLGVIGEYLGKMFIETKNRPNYIIKEGNL